MNKPTLDALTNERIREKGGIVRVRDFWFSVEQATSDFYACNMCVSLSLYLFLILSFCMHPSIHSFSKKFSYFELSVIDGASGIIAIGNAHILISHFLHRLLSVKSHFPHTFPKFVVLFTTTRRKKQQQQQTLCMCEWVFSQSVCRQTYKMLSFDGEKKRAGMPTLISLFREIILQI